MAPEALCRELAARAAMGALATIAREPAGFPYASLVAVAIDLAGRPLFCLSKLAEHTRNLEACADASLLLTEGASLEAGRVTLLGSCTRVPGDESPGVRATFLAVHPEAEAYAGFADFSMYRLEPRALRWIAGFGRMAWVSAEGYRAAWARPDGCV